MKKAFKFFAVTVAAAMALTFTGCNNTPASSGDTNATTANTTAAAAGGIAKADIKVGVLYIGDPADAPGYTYAHDQGIIQMQKALGLADSQIERKINVDDQDNAAIKTALDGLIADGCNIIFGTSYGYMDALNTAAGEHPEIYFSHCSGSESNGTNFNNYFGRIYQARYLAGIAAGLKTKTNLIGYVAAFGDTMAETSSGINAFALGAQAVNPNVKVYVKVMNSWFDPTQEAAQADALIAMNCDVIGQHCDTSNPQTEAEKKQVWGCGYNADMTSVAPDAHLTAPVWNWGIYYTEAVQAVIDGTFAQLGNYYGGLKDGLVDVSPLSANCAENTADYISQVRALIDNGTWDVFTGTALSFGDDGKVVQTPKDLLKADGSVLVAAGGPSVPNEVIQVSMNYYVQGVENK